MAAGVALTATALWGYLGRVAAAIKRSRHLPTPSTMNASESVDLDRIASASF